MSSQLGTRSLCAQPRPSAATGAVEQRIDDRASVTIIGVTLLVVALGVLAELTGPLLTESLRRVLTSDAEASHLEAHRASAPLVR